MTGSMLTAVCVIILGGCATFPDADCPIADPSLRMEASSCDNETLVELGKKYENGIGVHQDYRKAAVLYRLAASASPDLIYIYSPPVGRESYGRVIPVRTGTGRTSSPEALYRLGLLYLNGTGVKADRRKSERLFREAARAGFVAAEDISRH